MAQCWPADPEYTAVLLLHTFLLLPGRAAVARGPRGRG